MAGDGFGEITERLRRSTVQVRCAQRSCGSGVIWGEGGVIVTNAHVLQDGNARVEFWNGHEVSATIERSDRRRDLAVLRVEAGGLSPVTAGNSDALRPGELVIAVGSPFGFSGAVSTGVIHSAGPIRGFANLRGISNLDWVVSNVRLAPGNSGGPLANARGEVIGLNTMIAGGLGLAVPSNVVAQFVKLPRRREPSLGVVVRQVTSDGRVGFLILETAQQSPAEHASLMPGDVLIGAAGKPLTSLKDLSDALHSSRDGHVEVEFRRGGTATQTRKVVAQVAVESVRAA